MGTARQGFPGEGEQTLSGQNPALLSAEEGIQIPAAGPRSALLLVARGNADRPLARRSIDDIVRKLSGLNLFAETAIAFDQQNPSIDSCLAAFRNKGLDQITVLPLLTGEETLSLTGLPEALGAPRKGAARQGIDDRWQRRDGLTIRLLQSAGRNPDLARVILDRSLSLQARSALDPARCAILLISLDPDGLNQGGKNQGGKSQAGMNQTRTAAELTLETLQQLAARTPDAPQEIGLTWFTRSPEVAKWEEQIKAPDVLVFPLLMSESFHHRFRLPFLFGIGNMLSERPLGAELDENSLCVAGPISWHNRRIWFHRGLGQDPGLLPMLLNQLETAIKG